MDRTTSEQPTPAIGCFSRDRLRQYLAGWTDDSSTIEIESHLSSCATCEQSLTELEEESDSLLVPLRDPSQPSIEQDPIIAQALDTAKQRSNELESPIIEQLSSIVPPLVPPSSELGPYQLLQPLGRGGMGMVYLAKHRRLNKQVAIKLLPSLFVGTETQARFEREILAAGQLKHSSIVLATDAGQSGGVQYLVMEYIDGLDLGRLARASNGLSIADVCEIGRQIALGLSFAHAAGMVHRDIKPSNVMLDASGSVKILDFGLVLLDRWDGVSSELTTVGQFLGTLDYMAPEQAERCGAVDYRADLYSLGATLFRLLCGRAPLAAAPNQSPLEKLRLLANHRPPSLRTMCPDAPAELVSLVDQLLSTNPNERPPSAAHVAEQLASLAKDADLALLLDIARKTEADPPTTAVPSIAYPSQFVPNANAASSDNGSRATRRWLAAAASLPFLFFAGYWIVLETSKGQLVIDSEVADVQVKILRNGEPLKDLNIQTGSTSTRLAADRYEIIIQSPSDGLSIDNNKFVLKNGQTVVARIQNKASTLDTLLPSPRLRGDGPGVRGESLDSSHAQSNPSPDAGKTNPIVYDGKTFDEWLFIFKTERNSKILGDADDATRQLVTPARRDELDDARFELMQSSQLLSTYIVDLAERPERNVTRLISILDTNLPGNREILPELFQQAILHDSPAWDPLWNWLDTRMASTDPANAITEDEVNQKILNKTRNLGKYGRLSELFYPKVTDREFLRIRSELTKRVLPLMKKSKKVKTYFFSLPAAIAESNSEEFVNRDLLQYAVDFLEDQENATPENLLASLNLLHRLDEYDALPPAKLRMVLDQFLARIVKQNYEMKVDDPTRTPLTESEVDLGFPYSWIDFGGIRAVETHRLLIPCILLHRSRLGSDPNSTTGLQELVTVTKVIHDEFRQGVIGQFRQGKANLRIGIDRNDLNFVTSSGPYGLSSTNSASHGQGGIAFVLHCWANQLLGTHMPSLLPITNAAQPQDFLAPQPQDPLLPSPRLRGEGPGVRGESQESQPLINRKSDLASEQPLYKGKTLDEWIVQMRREKDGPAWLETFHAIHHEADQKLKRELREEIFSAAIEHGQLADPVLCINLATWTSAEDLAQAILQRIEKIDSSKLTFLLKQSATPIVVLPIPLNLWNPLWKKLEAIQFDPKQPSPIDDSELQAFFTSLVRPPTEIAAFEKSESRMDRALLILDSFPKLGHRYLLFDVCMRIYTGRWSSSNSSVALRDWEEKNLESLSIHKLAVLEDSAAKLDRRVLILDFITNEELSNPDRALRISKSIDNLMILAAKESTFLFGVSFKPSLENYTDKTKARTNAIKIGTGNNPSAASRLNSYKAFAILLFSMERLPVSMRPHAGLDAVIEATQETHDATRDELRTLLGVEDLSATSFTWVGRTARVHDNHGRKLRSLDVDVEMQSRIDIYFCHRWAKELRGTPTIDSVKLAEMMEAVKLDKDSSKSEAERKSAPLSSNSIQPVYEGKTYDEWFLILKTERSDTERPKIYEAIRVLRTPERDAELDAYLREMFQSRPGGIGEYLFLLSSRLETHLPWMLGILEKELPERQALLRNFISSGCMSTDSSWDPLWVWLRDQMSLDGPSKKICEFELQNYFADGNGLWFLNNQSPFKEKTPDAKAARVEKFISLLLSYIEVSTSLRDSLFSKIAFLIDEKSPDDRKQRMVEYALELLSNRETTPYNQQACLALLVRFSKSEWVDSDRWKSVLDQLLTNLATLDLSTTFADDEIFSSPVPAFSSPIGKFISLKPTSTSSAQRSQIATVLSWISLLETDQNPAQGLQAIAAATKERHDEYEKYLLTEMEKSKGRLRIQLSWPDLQRVTTTNLKFQDADRIKLLSFNVHEWAQQLLGSALPDRFSGIVEDDLPAGAEERWVQFSALQIKKYDKDQNSRLTPDEWPASSGDFNAVDTNSDGSISLGEYYIMRVKK